MASSPTLAQPPGGVDSPFEVGSVELLDTEAGADVLVGVSEAAEWVAGFEPDGSLVLFLARSVPGPGALDLAPSAGLVSSVEVGFAVPEGIPTTRIVVHGRSAFDYEVRRTRGQLTVELRAVDGRDLRAARPAPPLASSQEAEFASIDSLSPDEAGRGLNEELQRARARVADLERDLSQAREDFGDAVRVRLDLEALLEEKGKEAETYRDRVATLHSDRLELIEELRASRDLQTRTAAGNAAADSKAVEELALTEKQRDDAREEAEMLRRRLAGGEAALSEAASEAKRTAGELAALSERRQVERRELARLRTELEEVRAAQAAGNEARTGEADALRSQVIQLEEEMKAASARAEKTLGELEASHSEAQRLAQELEETRQGATGGDASEIVDMLRRQLDESRQSEADLRSWLARAPRILGANSLAVSEVATPCLSFRPEPAQRSPVLDCLAPGTVVEVLSIRPDWLRVRLADRREGWVGQRFLEPVGNQETGHLVAARRRAEEQVENLVRERESLSSRVAALESDLEALAGEAAEEDTLRALNDKVASLGDRLRTSQAEAEQLRSERDSLQAREQDLRARLAVSSRQDEVFEVSAAEVEALRVRVADLEESLAVARARERDLQTSLSSSEEQLAAQRGQTGEVDELQRRVAELGAGSEEAARLRSELGATTAALGEAKTTIAALQEDREELTAEQQRQAGMVSDRDQLAADLKAASDRMAGLERALVAAQSKERELLASIATVEKQNVELRGVAGEVDELRRRIAELTLGSENAVRLQAELDSTVAALGEAERTITAMREEREEQEALQQERQPVTVSERDQLATDLATARGRIAQLEESVVALQSSEQIEALRSDLEAMVSARDIAEARIIGLEDSESELESVRRQLADVMSERDDLAARLESSRKRIADLELTESEVTTAALKEAEALRAETEAAIAARAELELARTRVAEMERELDARRSESEALESFFRERESDLERRLSQAQLEIEQLRREVEEPTSRSADVPAVEAVQARLTTALAALETLESERNTLRAKLENAEEANTQLAARVETLEDQTRSVPPESSQEPRVEDLSAEIVAMVSAWAEAWSAQDIDAYLGFYSAGFEPAAGLGRGAWKAQRRQHLGAPSFIEVRLSSFDVRIGGTEGATVTFRQSYRSDTFEDLVTKTLHVGREEGSWKILEEVVSQP
jgi:chromosome segregation ATPase